VGYAARWEAGRTGLFRKLKWEAFTAPALVSRHGGVDLDKRYDSHTRIRWFDATLPRRKTVRVRSRQTDRRFNPFAVYRPVVN
jgi:hypothetical protein